jgi:pSer/pThr/pTyr-binding forkhead associated (FHA) protein
MVNLVIISAEDGVGKKFPLIDGDLLIGRAEDAGVRINDKKASLRHCMIHTNQGSFEIEDLKSRNGTFINGVKLNKASLSIGDRIVIGSTVFELRKGPR